jgi:hypothetical protein
MGKVAYLFGAGASCYCLPMIDGMKGRLENFRVNLVHFTLKYPFNKFENTELTRIKLKEEIIGDLEKIIREVDTYASIDTYAKSLLLSNRIVDYNTLKVILSLFFIYEQALQPTDKRYDSFFASILGNSWSDFPDIRIISWNYDFQFEKSFNKYSKGKTLRENQIKLNVIPVDTIPNDKAADRFVILKLNGTTSFIEKYETKLKSLLEENENFDLDQFDIPEMLEKFLDYYHRCLYFKKPNLLPSLSFAWEQGEIHQKTLELAKMAIKDSEALVIIGYSFPFFNREIDKQIFSALGGSTRKIYIQDIHFDVIKANLLSVLPVPSNYKDKIEFYKATTDDGKIVQFLLPAEL